MRRQILVICLACISGPALAQQHFTPKTGEIWKEPHTGMEFVWVPGGCFQMG